MNEYFEILKADGRPSGRVKERNAVHRDGDLHGGVHIWVIRFSELDNAIEILLQRRRGDKDSFPGCLDVSSAGHVQAGEDFLTTALRELEEELGLIVGYDDLIYLFSQVQGGEYIFHNKSFINNEYVKIYLLSPDVSLEDLSYQEEEISELIWLGASKIKQELERDNTNFCINKSEFQKIYTLLRALCDGRTSF